MKPELTIVDLRELRKRCAGHPTLSAWADWQLQNYLAPRFEFRRGAEADQWIVEGEEFRCDRPGFWLIYIVLSHTSPVSGVALLKPDTKPSSYKPALRSQLNAVEAICMRWPLLHAALREIRISNDGTLRYIGRTIFETG